MRRLLAGESVRVSDGEGATLVLRAADATEWGVWRAALVGVVEALKQASAMAGPGFKPTMSGKSYSTPSSMRASYDADGGGGDDGGEDEVDQEALRSEATRREAQIAKMQVCCMHAV